MIVNFFSVRQNENLSNIKDLYKSFGENIPLYLPLEGGSGINYLFCVVGNTKDLFEICKSHHYDVNGCFDSDEFDDYAFKKIEIEDEKYNPNYYACPTYYGDKLYKLSKVN